METTVKKKSIFYWSTEHLVIIGIFAAMIKVVTLIVSLMGGGMNPVSLFIKNGLATVILLILAVRISKPGVFILYCLVSQVVSLIFGGFLFVFLLPGTLLGACIADVFLFFVKKHLNVWTILPSVMIFDFMTKASSLAFSFLMVRENIMMFYLGAFFIVLGYLGCLLIGIPLGIKLVKELQHAGIIRTV